MTYITNIWSILGVKGHEVKPLYILISILFALLIVVLDATFWHYRLFEVGDAFNGIVTPFLAAIAGFYAYKTYSSSIESNNISNISNEYGLFDNIYRDLLASLKNFEFEDMTFNQSKGLIERQKTEGIQALVHSSARIERQISIRVAMYEYAYLEAKTREILKILQLLNLLIDIRNKHTKNECVYSYFTLSIANLIEPKMRMAIYNYKEMTDSLDERIKNEITNLNQQFDGTVKFSIYDTLMASSYSFYYKRIAYIAGIIHESIEKSFPV